jgi:hypothetical protein
MLFKPMVYTVKTITKILAILRGRYKVEATWMTDHTERDIGRKGV